MIAVVTGGAGFIGSNLVEALIARGDEVRVIDDLSGGYRENVHPDATFFEGATTDADLVDTAMAGAEVVFHQAAHRSVFRSVEAPLATDHANTHGTLTVLDAAHRAGARRVVSASSSSVYGGAEARPTPESTPLTPRSPYAVTKLAGEHYCRVYAELYGLETVALRYFNVYGPRQRPDSMYAAVIPLFIDAVRKGEPPTVHGDGRQSRDFAYISDVVRANLLAAAAPAERASGRAYNIAGGRERSLLDLLAIVAEVLDKPVTPNHVAPRAGDVRHSCADLSAAAADLGYVPEVTFEDGLRRTVDWFT
ncbi:MAG: nucleoside-diphosphate-sugar epimerase [Acidimicrobiales bacterium]|nr:nucleoside-diphosphate-sugar epimerase [Acidimicrobiales bacterium]